MPIDPDAALAIRRGPIPDRWDEDRVILYHLGIGAGASLDRSELDYVDEHHLKVLPTFSCVPALGALRPTLQGPGLEYELSRMVHGEHSLTVHKPLLPSARVETTISVERVFDLGRHAGIVYRADTNQRGGTPVATNRFTLLLRGEGGFGGSPPPESAPWEPVGPPSTTCQLNILAQQGAIYRLSGDRNPIHFDPEAAAAAGFDAPLLSGLCTYGMVLKAVVDHACDGDPTAVAQFEARFTAPVYNGQALTVQIWPDANDTVLVQAVNRGTGAVALANGRVRLA